MHRSVRFPNNWIRWYQKFEVSSVLSVAGSTKALQKRNTNCTKMALFLSQLWHEPSPTPAVAPSKKAKADQLQRQRHASAVKDQLRTTMNIRGKRRGKRRASKKKGGQKHRTKTPVGAVPRRAGSIGEGGCRAIVNLAM